MVLTPTPNPSSGQPPSFPAGKAVRFAVFSEDGRRSSTWVAWTSKRRLDAYIQNLSARNSWKVSLHESGSWQHGLLKESTLAQALPVGQSRHWDIWAAPDEASPGIRRTFCVVLPDAELRVMPTEADDHETIRVPAPGFGYAAWVEFMFMSGPTGIQFPEPAFDIAEVRRADGTNLRIVARQVKLSDTQLAYLDEKRGEARSKVPSQALEGRSEHVRMFLAGEIEQDHTRVAWELAFD